MRNSPYPFFFCSERRMWGGKERVDYVTIIGLAAAALGGLSLFPQLLKVFEDQIHQRPFNRHVYYILH